MRTTADLSAARILVVDDDDLTLSLMASMLRLHGFSSVATTCDPQAVLGLHQAQRFDLILLDLNMPAMDGFAVLAALRDLGEHGELPIVALTADPAHKLRALQSGAMAFVTKPFNCDELLARIRNLLTMQLAHQLRRSARDDELTGLPLRAHFEQQVDAALADANPDLSALLLVGLHGFARINDGIGFHAGDAVVSQFVHRVQLLLPAGAMLGRLGTDEFGLFLPAPANRHDITRLADAVRASCAQPFALAEGETLLGVHVGVALRPADADDAATLAKHAGAALHQARKHPPGTVLYYRHAMDEQSRCRFELEAALRVALERRQFVLHYQPKVDLGTGSMVSAEALLRWERPGHGLVAPAEFVGLLEETGLIVPVGAWVIDEACRQLAEWAALSVAPLQVAVNIASRQFAECDLVAEVTGALARHGVPAGRLAIEVTESALMADTARASDTLAALRALGVQVAIDDFGTGHSSLAYLKCFPVDTLKIDRAFIGDVTTSPADASLVAAIIVLAHSMHLNVVAEGVETVEQRAFLERRGCDQAQGYLFSKALPAARFGALLRAGTPLGAVADTPAAPQRTLLIVDDEVHVLSALERLFRSDGYRILKANGAAEALRLLARHPVQVILCDQRMDGMSGTEFFDRVKTIYPDTLRIILSGYTELTTIIDAVNRGSLYRFYTKPWDNATLRKEMLDAFQHHWQLHGKPAAPAALALATC